MFFFLAKLVGFIIKPLNILLLLLAGAAFIKVIADKSRRKNQVMLRKIYRVTVIGLVIWISNLMMPIIPYQTLSLLEHRFPHPDLTATSPDVIVILGGWQGRPDTMRDVTTPPISGSGDRLITGLILAQKFPDALIAMPGGLKRFGDLSEADISQAVLDGLKLDHNRFVIEGMSRNTAENAVLLKTMLDNMTASHQQPNHDGQMILITSAAHMPRAIGAFRRAGLNPIAYPTDYMTSKSGLNIWGLFGNGLNYTHVAMREMIGLMAYYLTGRSDAMIPKP